MLLVLRFFVITTNMKCKHDINECGIACYVSEKCKKMYDEAFSREIRCWCFSELYGRILVINMRHLGLFNLYN